MRPRPTVLHAHSSQWLGSVGKPGKGKDWRRAVGVIPSSRRAHPFPAERAPLLLDGLEGTGAVWTDRLGVPFVMRGNDARVRDLPIRRARARNVTGSARARTALT